jgi:hypothetical protein
VLKENGLLDVLDVPPVFFPKNKSFLNKSVFFVPAFFVPENKSIVVVDVVGGAGGGLGYLTGSFMCLCH